MCLRPPLAYPRPCNGSSHPLVSRQSSYNRRYQGKYPPRQRVCCHASACFVIQRRQGGFRDVCSDTVYDSTSEVRLTSLMPVGLSRSASKRMPKVVLLDQRIRKRRLQKRKDSESRNDYVHLSDVVVDWCSICLSQLKPFLLISDINCISRFRRVKREGQLVTRYRTSSNHLVGKAAPTPMKIVKAD